MLALVDRYINCNRAQRSVDKHQQLVKESKSDYDVRVLHMRQMEEHLRDTVVGAVSETQRLEKLLQGEDAHCADLLKHLMDKIYRLEKQLQEAIKTGQEDYDMIKHLHEKIMREGEISRDLEKQLNEKIEFLENQPEGHTGCAFLINDLKRRLERAHIAQSQYDMARQKEQPMEGQHHHADWVKGDLERSYDARFLSEEKHLREKECLEKQLRDAIQMRRQGDVCCANLIEENRQLRENLK